MPDPEVDRTWPITIATLRKALAYKEDQGDDDELALFAQSACERIDIETGRDLEPTRHETSGSVPLAFIMAARELAKFSFQQSKNGPRGLPQTQGDQPAGVPFGIDLPRKVQGLISNYPPPPGFGQPLSDDS